MSDMKPDILYEDNHIIVVNKPPGMLSQGDDTGDIDLLTYLKGYVKDKYNKPGDAYIGLVHRLDRPVSGLMVFARTSKAASRLSNQVTTQKMKKEYICICEGTPPDGKWVDWLYKDKRTNTTTVMSDGARGAKRASLECRMLYTEAGESVCRVELYTGRSHQIRVQFLEKGCPLVGDQKYNPNAKAGEWIALMSQRLTFWHPTLNEKMVYKLELPDEMPWVKYKYLIDLDEV